MDPRNRDRVHRRGHWSRPAFAGAVVPAHRDEMLLSFTGSATSQRRGIRVRTNKQHTIAFKKVMVPRGGIEPSPIQLKVHHFFNGDFPVYLPVDPALSSRPGGVRLSAAIPKSCACHALYKRRHQRRVLCANTDWSCDPIPSEGGGHTFESCRVRHCTIS